MKIDGKQWKLCALGILIDILYLSKKILSLINRLQDQIEEIKPISSIVINNTRNIIGSFLLPMEVIKENGSWKLIPGKNLQTYYIYYSLLQMLKNREISFFIWIGCLEIPKEEFTPDDFKNVKILLKSQNLYHIIIKREILEKNIKFVTTQLNNIFQNFVDPQIHKDFLVESWNAFNTINFKIGDKIKNYIGKLKFEYNISAVDKNHENQNALGDEITPSIWLIDIHVLLAPRTIIQAMPSSNIGLFISSFFPSGDILHTFPFREIILQSLLLCNYICFSSYSYARNFLICCKRILSLGHEDISGKIYIFTN